MTASDLRWHTIILIAICWVDGPLQVSAQTTLLSSQTSLTSEQQIQDEVRYLQEETIGLADQHDQLLVQAASINDLPTDDNTLDASRTDLLMRLRQGHTIGMMPLSTRGFTLSLQGEKSRDGRYAHDLAP